MSKVHIVISQHSHHRVTELCSIFECRHIVQLCKSQVVTCEVSSWQQVSLHHLCLPFSAFFIAEKRW